MSKRNQHEIWVELKRLGLILAGCLFLLVGPGVSLVGCEDEVKPASPPPPAPAASRGQQGRRGRGAAVEEQASTGEDWTPRRNRERRQIDGRDPFFGFIDILLEEKARQEALAQQTVLEEEEMLLPIQRFEVKDFRLLGVITGTAEPKAYLVDPTGQRHVLKRGDFIGKRGGTVSVIRRDSIDIYEVGDGYIPIKLHAELPPGFSLEVN